MPSLLLLRYNIGNCRERRVVIVESVVTPTRIRHLLADIILKQFEVARCFSKSLGQHAALVLFLGIVARIYPVAIRCDVYVGSKYGARSRCRLSRSSDHARGGVRADRGAIR